MNKRSYPEESPEVTKAGLIVYGRAPDASGKMRTHVLACWTEGRFTENMKAYTMPKGSIDEGENPLRAAIRESEEETGVSIKKLMGQDAFQRFMRGEEVSNLAEVGYPGVRVLSATPAAVRDHTYISGHGAKHRTQYFAIELEGIEKLESHLKRMDEDEKSVDASVSKTAEVWKEERALPTLEELVNVMRTGKMPRALRERFDIAKADEVVLESPKLPALEKAWKRTHPKSDLTQIKCWKDFCAHTEGFKDFKPDLDTLRLYLRERGIVGDSGKQLKLDTRDKPLNFYQEGGAILPVGELLARMEHVAAESNVYRKSVWGEYSGRKRPDPSAQEKALSAQNSPLVSFFMERDPEEVEQAFAHKRVGRVARQEKALDALPLAKRSFVAHEEERMRAAGEDPTTRIR